MTNLKIRESLNKIDHKALDEGGNFYDFVTAFDSVKNLITDANRDELVESIVKKDSEGINTFFTKLQSINNDDDFGSLVEKYGEAEQDNSLKTLNEEFINEGRNDLKAVKCYAEKSHKSYWSPYDTEEKDFAKFGIRFRYETKEKCLEAINDPDNDLGYGDKKEANESIIEEVELDEMAVQNPDLSKTRRIGTYAKFIIKLYELSNGDTTKSVPMIDLCQASGEPKEAGTYTNKSGGQHRNLAIRAGYAEKDGHWGLHPTQKLIDLMNSNSALMDEYLSHKGIDYPERKFTGKNNGKGKNGVQGAGADLELDELDFGDEENTSTSTTNEPAEEPVKTTEPETEVEPEDTDEFSAGDDDLFDFEDSLNEDFITEEFKESDDNKYVDAYKKWMQLSDDELLSEDIDDYDVEDMCTNHGWNPTVVKKALLKSKYSK